MKHFSHPAQCFEGTSSTLYTALGTALQERRGFKWRTGDNEHAQKLRHDP